MQLWLKILIIVLVVLVIALGLLYYFGNKLQKRQAESQAMMESMAQTVNLLVIDKKMMKFKDAGFPQMVYDQSPKYLKRSKVPVVKAKIGPRIMTMMCDKAVFDVLPVKQECRVVTSGIYISAIKSARGSIVAAPAKKKGWRERLADKAAQTGKAARAAQEASKKNKKSK